MHSTDNDDREQRSGDETRFQYTAPAIAGWCEPIFLRRLMTEKRQGNWWAAERKTRLSGRLRGAVRRLDLIAGHAEATLPPSVAVQRKSEFIFIEIGPQTIREI